MNNDKRFVQLLELLLNDVKEIRTALIEDATENNYLVSRINFLEGKIEGAKIALEWEREKSELKVGSGEK